MALIATGVLAQTAMVVDHFLDAQDIEVPKLGATSGIDRFTQAQTWTRLEIGESVYDGVRAWECCEFTERVNAGESAVYVALAVEPHIERDVAPGEAGDASPYHNRSWHRLDDLSNLSR